MAARILIEIELNHFNEELRRRLAMYPGHDKLQDLRRPMVADDANETAVAQVNPPALPQGQGLAVAVTQKPTVQRMAPQVPGINVLIAVAAKIVGLQRSYLARADALDRRADAFNLRMDPAFGGHEALMTAAEAGMDALEQGLVPQAGHNRDPNGNT
jgi:hypothetical protein